MGVWVSVRGYPSEREREEGEGEEVQFAKCSVTVYIPNGYFIKRYAMLRR